MHSYPLQGEKKRIINYLHLNLAQSESNLSRWFIVILYGDP